MNTEKELDRLSELDENKAMILKINPRWLRLAKCLGKEKYPYWQLLFRRVTGGYLVTRIKPHPHATPHDVK